MKVKKIVLAASLIAAMAGGAAMAESKKIRIGTEGAYKPWNFTDSSGKLVGFEIDLGEDLCARMNADCEFVPQAWEGIIPALTGGKFDIIMAGMSITEERKKVISFTRNYAGTPAFFAAMKGSDLESLNVGIDSITLEELSADEEAAIAKLKEALAGKVIGVQVSTTHLNFLNEHLADVAEIRQYDTTENHDLDLFAGRIDVALAAVAYWKSVQASDKGKELITLGPGMTGGPFGAGVGGGMRQDDAELAGMFNDAINAAIEDGTIKTLSEKWFGFDISPK